MRKRRYRVLTAVAVCFSVVIWLFFSWLMQINNSIRLQQYAANIKKNHKETGLYPETFEGADFWGRPVFYRRCDDHFILASFGLGGSGDGRYGCDMALSSNRKVTYDACLWPFSDTVFIDGRSVRVCLK